ncbi:hypothetical protein L1987_82634 [Smallanthus sonchifolius]|uniref:Uncharacterized protein n=1 Tax=Smallanthus sonchifolius TaxID=185202 RepID=A0ACB8YA87_9ASTR|nr:hypothetical protein L1987_82634 [Smallanthus sonchifolius]
MILEKIQPSIFLLTLFIFSISTQFWVSYSQTSPTIYEILKLNGLPMGLFPKGVTNFSVDDSGRFQVYLDEACNAKFEDELHYDQNVSGNLTFGRINELTGISAKDLFLWFLVKEIWVDIPSSGLIYFDVGVVSKQFSLSSFETPRNCSVSSASKILSRKLGRDEPNHQEPSRAIL